MTCAHAVSVAMQKIDGVASVEVTLKRGHALVELKPGNHVKIEQLWEAVRKQGLTPKDTDVVLRGTITGTSVNVQPAGATYDVRDAPVTAGASNITGTMTPTKKGRPSITVTRIGPG